MNILKIILALLGLVLGAFVVLWVLGFVWSILWYLIVFGVIGAIGYGGYKLFRKAEDKYIGGGSSSGAIGARDYDLSWDEYERKYLQK